MCWAVMGEVWAAVLSRMALIRWCGVTSTAAACARGSLELLPLARCTTMSCVLALLPYVLGRCLCTPGPLLQVYVAGVAVKTGDTFVGDGMQQDLVPAVTKAAVITAGNGTH